MGSVQVFPAPTVVVGVGSLGLEVLERLRADWEALRRAGGDDTLENLRLLHLTSGEQEETSWRRLEGRAARLARHAGESDLPSLAVNLVILRSLGLVRYRDGAFQVAVPRDGGVVEVPDLTAVGASGQGGGKQLRRRRYFEWLSLSPDPVTAVERLYRQAESISELDQFITPILNRVRQGHSPRALLACIGRCHALAAGRDPSPWTWVKDLARDLGRGAAQGLELLLEPGNPRGEALLGLCAMDLHPLSRQHPLGPLDHYAPPPLAGWSRWLEARHGAEEGVEPDVEKSEKGGGAALSLLVPAPFVPRAGDLEQWLDPLALLEVDWEASGWATGEALEQEPVTFEPVQASPFRLGLFDHDSTPVARRSGHRGLAGRLRVLAELARRGLVRLWIDLQRDRVEETSAQVAAEDRRRESADEALRQSLEILGELLIRPLADEGGGGAAKAEVEEEGADSPDDPAAGLVDRGAGSARLAACDLGRYPGDGDAGRSVGAMLDRRLASLGEPGGSRREVRRPLCRTVCLSPADVLCGAAQGEPGAESPARVETPSEGPATGLAELAQVLNHQVRELLHIRWLEHYRNRPIRRPPRLTLFLVGDMGEPFVRGAMRTVLREIHAELLRSFSPIFEHYREGFDRSLSIVPILWMPHPADPFAGRASSRRPEEEAAIVDAVQGLRRWVESVIPVGRRRVSQIFVNSFLTNTAVLDRRDAVRQTRDFITLQTRNDLGADEWLRRTAVGPAGDDFFSSFACYEIELPAETAQSYLANRLARELLTRLRHGREDRPVRVDSRPLEPPSVEDLLRGVGSRLSERTSAAATKMVHRVEARCEIDPSKDASGIASRFGEDLGRQLALEVQGVWGEMVQHLGELDTWTMTLRRRTSRLLGETLGLVRRQEDGWIEELAGHRGLTSVHAGFTELRRTAREKLEAAEKARRREEERCRRHGIPQPLELEEARLEVVAAAEAKPDLGPMGWGLGLWLVLAPVLGGLSCRVLAGWLGIEEGSGLLALLLGPYGPWTGGLGVVALGGWWLRTTMRTALARISCRIRELAAACGRLIDGDGVADWTDARPSLRSFFDARLRLAAALAARGFSDQLSARVELDTHRLERLERSVDLQLAALQRQAEALGVRPAREDSAGPDQLEGLFTRGGWMPETLVDPRSIGAYFDRKWSHAAEHAALLPPFLRAVGGFEGWRQRAPLADAERILAYCRQPFATLGGLGLCRQHPFAEEAGRRLREFVARHYPNIGFGARFEGSEGLDPDGVHILASAALVLPPDMRKLFSQGGGLPGAAENPSTTRTMQIVACGVRPSVAYLLSLAQGIRPHTVRNLRRFESFHDRATLPEDRTFPLSGDGGEPGSLNHLTAYGALAHAVFQGFSVPTEPTEQAAGPPRSAAGLGTAGTAGTAGTEGDSR